MSTQTIDYDALAKQAGAVSSAAPQVDYEALAKQAGAIKSETPTSQPNASLWERTKAGVQAAIQHPGEALVGAVKEIPALAQSMLPSAQSASGTSADIAQQQIAQRFPNADAAKMNAPAVQDAYQKASQVVTGATTPQTEAEKAGARGSDVASFIAPAAELPALAKQGWVAFSHNALPSAMKEDAGALFQTIAKDANKVPVVLDNSQDAALRLMDWQKKTQLGPTLNKFLNRITNPKLGPMTYDEARDFQQLVSKMSAEETSKLAPTVQFQVKRLAAGLKADVGNAAGEVGRAADYYKAMGDYHKAAQLQEFYDLAKKYMTRGALLAVGGGLAGTGAHFAQEYLEGK